MAIPKFGAGIGLHRMAYLCSNLQNSAWWSGLDPINIVGTNGKGSTSAMVAAILSSLGISTGLYTSPHLLNFSERFQINGNIISKAELEVLIQAFFAQQKKYQLDHPEEYFGAFEAFTSIALHYFFQKKTEALVLEAGIGGRFDPTRICTGNLIGMTSLDLEHTQLLGNSLAEIGMDKMDIAVAGSTLILGNIDEKVNHKLLAYAAIKKINLLSLKEEAQVHSIEFLVEKMRIDFSIQGLEFGPTFCNLVGYHQVENMLMAVLLVKKWLSFHRPEIGEREFQKAVANSLKDIHWPGRFEKIHNNPEIYIDVGHTPKALNQLARTASKVISKPILLICGVSKDKKEDLLLREILPLASEVVGTQSYHRGASMDRVTKALENLNKGNIPIENFPNIETSLEYALKRASTNNMCILIAGSLFLAIEAKAFINEQSPKELHFF